MDNLDLSSVAFEDGTPLPTPKQEPEGRYIVRVQGFSVVGTMTEQGMLWVMEILEPKKKKGRYLVKMSPLLEAGDWRRAENELLLCGIPQEIIYGGQLNEAMQDRKLEVVLTRIDKKEHIRVIRRIA